ncbi:MAG TPA: hypothetical protein EYQ02_00325 [Microbacterium sp.]|nr:hypothetical protein [Microbacterium sp.]
MNRRRPFRAASIVIAAMLGAGALAGCGPTDPTPTPTPTGFASEAEAFAAAEATYRAYVDALNQVDLSDPSTFEEVYRWTTGDANAAERESLSGMHANGWTVSGESEVTGFNPTSWDAAAGAIDAVACIDVTSVELVDASGQSVVPAERPPRYALELVLIESSATPTGLTIDGSTAVEDPSCAAE